MKCECEFPGGEILPKPYMLACRFLSHDMTVMEVGCSNCSHLNNLANHIKTHDVNIKQIHIDVPLIKHVQNFCNKDVDEKTNIDAYEQDMFDYSVEFLLCFEFNCDRKNRKRHFQRMAKCLKKEGRALIDVVKIRKSGWLFEKIPFVKKCMRSVIIERKMMYRYELLLHIQECINEDYTMDGNKCTHGIVVK